MRGQYTNYDSFNLVELINELKTRIEPPFRADDTLHGAMIVGRDYHGTCKELRKWLEDDDKKTAKGSENTKEDKPIISIDLEKVVDNKQILYSRDYGAKIRKFCDLDNIDDLIAKNKK